MPGGLEEALGCPHLEVHHFCFQAAPRLLYPQVPYWLLVVAQPRAWERGASSLFLQPPLQSKRWNLAPGPRCLGPSPRSQHYSLHINIDITKEKCLGR